MLESKKSISLTGTSKINGKQIATFSASVYDDGTGNDTINTYIVDPADYAANKKQVRADLAEFQDLVWDAQDQLDTETAEKASAESKSK